MTVHAAKNYKVTETREVEVLVSDDVGEEEALRLAQSAFLNPTPGHHSRVTKPVTVVKTIIELVS